MIRALRRDSRRFEPADGSLDGRWIDVVAPSEAELERLVTELGVPKDFALHALDLDELARLDRRGEATLAVLEVPRRAPSTARVPFISVPLGVVWTGERVITIGLHTSELVERVAPKCPGDGASATRALLLLVDAAAAAFLTELRTIQRAIEAVEERLESSLHNREVLQLLRYQKALVFFTTALEQNELLLERLRADAEFRVEADDLRLVEEVLVEVRQARDMTAVSMNILSETMDAFASIISNNLNVVMKVLTSLTLVLTLPSLVVGAWGMNVTVPLQAHPRAFATVLGGALTVSGLLLFLFRRLRWL
jgi:magnesium transporter